MGSRVGHQSVMEFQKKRREWYMKFLMEGIVRNFTNTVMMMLFVKLSLVFQCDYSLRYINFL